ncbi:MAG TPA: proteasome subunit beta [Candidatus Lokiarchaeia archaeon]|nr:proteasome subunit beta [Candidatus Lokiarchaeia archaeon]
MKNVDDQLKALLENRPDIKIVDLDNPITGSKTLNEQLKTGTTTCGLKVDGGVVLAGDRRATAGAFVASKVANKVNRLTDFIWMTIAGGVADAQYLIDVMAANAYLFEMRRKRKMPVKSLGWMLGNMLFRNKMTPFEVGLIVGGYTPEEGPVLLDIDGYGSVLPSDFTSIGSGSHVCIGVLEANWKPGLSPEEGKDLAVKAVRTSIARDIFTGNAVDVVVITASGYQFDRLPPK